MRPCVFVIAICLLLIHSQLATTAKGEVGDPQLRTDHTWYPGELAISTFPRLFRTQAEVYQRVTGVWPESDQEKALASWLWRNTHYWHGEAGQRDLWDQGLAGGHDTRLREYWNGLFGYGFGLCGTTHSQWTAEFNELLGRGRSRGVGTAGHNAMEVLLQGEGYAREGRWVLLDHDLSTVIFDDRGETLLGLSVIQPEYQKWTSRKYRPHRQQGWLVCGLHPADGTSYSRYDVAEYFPGYAGPPPMVHLRRGERMRRYFAPGLEDGHTFVFWGRNYRTSGIPGPERSRSWVNQPERMYGSSEGTPHRDGQVRYANVVYDYRPDFDSGDYREGLVREDADGLIFEFNTPYVIAATPPNDQPWGIYDDGCRNGLVIHGDRECEVSVSTDLGRSWCDAKRLPGSIDLTDYVKGRSQYWLHISGTADQLGQSNLRFKTVCQVNVAVLPRLKDHETVISFAASGLRINPGGPELSMVKSRITAGGLGESSLTLTHRSRRAVHAIYAAQHVASGTPPDPDIAYAIDYRVVGNPSWQPIVNNWRILRRGDEPADFWSQSFCYGVVEDSVAADQEIEVRCANDGGRRILRAETHLVEKTTENDAVKVTYHWSNELGPQFASHRFETDGAWRLATGRDVTTHWVEMSPSP